MPTPEKHSPDLPISAKYSPKTYPRRRPPKTTPLPANNSPIKQETTPNTAVKAEHKHRSSELEDNPKLSTSKRDSSSKKQETDQNTAAKPVNERKPDKTENDPRPKEEKSDPKTDTKKARIQKLKLFLIPMIAALIGVTLILYPVIATRHNNAHQRRILENYRVNLEANNAKDLENALKKADEYNLNLAEGKISDPFLVDIIPDSYEYQSYLQQLNVSKILGQIVIPSIRANLPIYHGTEEHTLQKGVGHLFGSSLPVGGKNTHSILTGHSGLASATMFDNLVKVKKGDKIFLNVSGRNMQYGVKEIKVVLPHETDSLKRREGKDLLTLITCTPYGINSHRLFVTAEREYPVDEKILNKELSQVDPPWETWMITLIVLALSGAILIGTMLLRTFLFFRKRQRSEENEEETAADKETEDEEAMVASFKEVEDEELTTGESNSEEDTAENTLLKEQMTE